MSSIEAKREHNLCLPVSHIPTEVLSRIFCIIRFSDTCLNDTRQWGDSCNFQRTCWMAIARVCHRWREVAIHTPMLWTHIVLSPRPGNDTWAKEMLRHSKRSPLVVVADLVPRGYSRSIDPSIVMYNDVKASLDRCRELSLRGVDTHFLLSFLSGSDYGQLESLRISYERGTSHIPTLRDIISRAQSLQRLQIEYGAINLHDPSLLRLTHLVLDHIPNLTCHSLFAMISRVSVLEVLHLTGSALHKTEDNITTSSENRVLLQSLKHLYMSSSLHSIDLFHQHIQLSRTCKVRLKADDLEQMIDETELEQNLSWIREHFQPPQSTDGAQNTTTPQNFLQSLCFYLCRTIIEIRAFHEIVSHEELVWGDPLFELTFDHYYDDEPPEALLTSFLGSLPLDHVVFLEVSIDMDFDLYSSVWMKAFARIPTLEKIFLDACSCSFFSLLHVPNLPFPNLTSITVKDFWVNDLGILESLRTRSELGAPLQEILFSSDRGLPPDHILRQLRDVVQHVGIHQRVRL